MFGIAPHAFPQGGKLVEIQVREGQHDWHTITHAFGTNPRGRYRLRYRFGKFYDQKITYRFRLKVTHEADWAYATPGHSRSRKVTIVPTVVKAARPAPRMLSQQTRVSDEEKATCEPS